ncbi:DUF4142 domain-containing protein [Fibrella sp. HMF5335]|uniref:DUF4142 domain-containing protein n=1 Tax=Fibrella rubiginis TaxID=2817060 RepID=A0A939GI17_9BACT|nr:DUF4142 domain-containing protein [Fibrella rubiginis]MBO0937140.1 DUF4142 domain-containing protein [Fibrella rubiginis]
MNKSANQFGVVGITTITLVLLAICILTLVSAGCSKDSTDKAEEANKARIEGQASAISNEAKDDAVKMADKMVSLASMNMTVRQLSEEATRRAVNPSVKDYAQRVLREGDTHDRELTNLAKTLKIDLPASLSNEGQDRVTELKKEKPGTAFDLKYLDELNKVVKKAANTADDLKDDATNDAVKKYAAAVNAAYEKRTDETKDLKNVLN